MSEMIANFFTKLLQDSLFFKMRICIINFNFFQNKRFKKDFGSLSEKGSVQDRTQYQNLNYSEARKEAKESLKALPEEQQGDSPPNYSAGGDW